MKPRRLEHSPPAAKLGAYLRRGLLWLAAMGLMLLSPCPLAVAQEANQDESLELSPVEVEASVIPVTWRRSLDRAGQEENVADLLEEDSSATVRENSKGELEIGLRGFDERQLSITIEGVPAELPYEGRSALGLIPASWIESLDIGSLAGVGLDGGRRGLGGALDLRLRGFDGPLAELTAELGLEQYRVDFFHVGQEGKLAWLFGGGLLNRRSWPMSGAFSATANEDGDERANSDRELYHSLLRLAYFPSEAHALELTFGALQSVWGVPPSTVAENPRKWRFTDWQQLLTSARHSWQISRDDLLESTLWYSGFSNVLEGYDNLDYDSQETAAAFHSTWRDHALGMDSRYRHRLFADPEDGQLDSNLSLSMAFAHHSAEDRDFGAEPAISRLSANAQAGLRWQLPRGDELSLQAGALFEWVPEAADQPTTQFALSSGADLGWSTLLAAVHPLVGGLALDWSAERGQRFPTLKERTAGIELDFAEENPPALGPEVALSGRLGLRFEHAPLKLRAALFASSIDGLIESRFNEDGFKLFTNVAQAQILGVEAGGSYQLWQHLKMAASYTLLKTWAEGAQDEATLAHRPDHQVASSISWRDEAWGGVELAYRFIGAQRSHDVFGSKEVELGSYSLINAQVEAYPLDLLKLWLRADNLLDTAYQTSYGYPGMGRSLFLGMALTL